MTDHLARQPLFDGSWRMYVMRNSSSSATARIFNPTGSFIGQLPITPVATIADIESQLRHDAKDGPSTVLLWHLREDNPDAYRIHIAPMRCAFPPDTAGEH
jgi:hypothetical protein